MQRCLLATAGGGLAEPCVKWPLLCPTASSSPVSETPRGAQIIGPFSPVCFSAGLGCRTTLAFLTHPCVTLLPSFGKPQSGHCHYRLFFSLLPPFPSFNRFHISFSFTYHLSMLRCAFACKTPAEEPGLLLLFPQTNTAPLGCKRYLQQPHRQFGKPRQWEIPAPVDSAFTFWACRTWAWTCHFLWSLDNSTDISNTLPFLPMLLKYHSHLEEACVCSIIGLTYEAFLPPAVFLCLIKSEMENCHSPPCCFSHYLNPGLLSNFDILISHPFPVL